MDTIITLILLSTRQYDALARWFAPFVEDGATPLPLEERRALVLVGHIAAGVAQPAPAGFGYTPSRALEYALDAVEQVVRTGTCDGY